MHQPHLHRFDNHHRRRHRHRVGEYSSITIGADGNPIISYYDGTADDLNVAACTNPTCTASTITTVDGTGFVG